jgi:hypothetical protein
MQPSAMDIFFVFIACLRLLLEVSDSRRPSWSPAIPVDFRQKIWRMPVMNPPWLMPTPTVLPALAAMTAAPSLQI